MKSVSYTTYNKLNCGCDAEVIICIDEALTASGAPYIEGTIAFSDSVNDACGRAKYRYALTYDEGLLLDPNYSLLESDIYGVVCRGCLTNYIDYNLQDNDWHVVGNAGTIDGVNFCGTTDDVAFDVRVNNARVRRSEPEAYGPRIIDGWNGNAIIGTNTSSAILSGGSSLSVNNVYRGPNKIYDLVDDPDYPNVGNLICGGTDNEIGATGDYSDNCVIVGGHQNKIYGDYSWSSFIGGGEENEISGQNCVIGGGNANYIYPTIEWVPDPPTVCFSVSFTDIAEYAVIGGGLANEVYGGLGGVIGGGESNLMTAAFDCTVGGGVNNFIGIDIWFRNDEWDGHEIFSSTIGGGDFNYIHFSDTSFIGGGRSNTIFGYYFVGAHWWECHNSYGNSILGGERNTILEGDYSSILGGQGLKLGDKSVGYQAESDAAFGIYPTYEVTSQTDLSALDHLAYFGDVDIWVGNIRNAARKIKFFEPNASLTYTGTHYSSFEAQAQAANIEYKLPAAVGVVGQVLKIQGIVGTVVTLEWANDLT